MTDPMEGIMLEELESEDRARTKRERAIVVSIFVIGVIIALMVGYEVRRQDVGYRSVRCEEGDVTLILEKANGSVERVTCPAVVAPKP